jgi:hypothetical protein
MRAVRLVDAVSSKNDLQRSHGFRAGGFPRVLRCLDWIGAADAICDDGPSGRTGFPQFQRGGGHGRLPGADTGAIEDQIRCLLRGRILVAHLGFPLWVRYRRAVTPIAMVGGDAEHGREGHAVRDKNRYTWDRSHALHSDVTERYSAGAPSIREALQDAKDAVVRAKEAVRSHLSSEAALNPGVKSSNPISKSMTGLPKAKPKVIAEGTPAKKAAPKKAV